MHHTSRAVRLILPLALAALSAACDDPQPAAPAPQAPLCTAGQFRPTSQPVGVSGGDFSAALTVEGACSWTLAPESAWISPLGAPAGVGSGTVRYRVSPNAGVARRAALALVTSTTARLLVTQDGPVAAPGCTYELRPTVRSFTWRLSWFEVQVFAPYGCRWAFEGNGDWITVEPEDSRPSPWGDGNGTVLVVVAENRSGQPRTGTAVIAGQAVTVTQDGTETPACQYAVTPASQSVPASGGARTASLATGPTCSWSIEDVVTEGPPTWLRITQPANWKGVGSGPIVVAFDANPGASSRSVQIVISGHSGWARLVAAFSQAGR